MLLRLRELLELEACQVQVVAEVAAAVEHQAFQV
jgi:hypothetical protein